MDGEAIMDDGNSSEWQPSGTDDDDEQIVARRPRLQRVKKCNVDYTIEQVDHEFDGEKGYTNFGRTRKGGDKRPRRVVYAVPKEVRKRVTMLNFFAAVGKQPLPKPTTTTIPHTPTKRKIPITRQRWGRPGKAVTKDSKVTVLKKRMLRKTVGDCAVEASPYRKWSGSVSVLFV